MMLFVENIKLALSAIKANKMRSFLTMLGIIIGVSSVIAITSIGASAKGAVNEQFDSIGTNYLYVMVNWQMVEDGYIESSDLFYYDDIEALKQRFPEDIQYAAPYVYTNSDTTVGRLSCKLSMLGVAAGYEKCANLDIIHGRMINENDVASGKDHIVIDVKAAEYLFGRSDVIGRTLPVSLVGEDRDMTIVGVYQEKESFFNSINTSERYSCYVPYSCVPYWDSGSSYVELYVNKGADVPTLGTAFSDYLCRLKDKPADFYYYQSAEAEFTMVTEVLDILSLAIGAIAAISLLVGGIGIMNIMLVSVTERTREIGIRKSLGARTGDILTQFLIEAMLLSAIGGVVGVAGGLGLAAIGMAIAGVTMVVEPAVIVIAVVFSAGVGLFFGLFPARKAARLDPIEALRYE